MLLKLAQEGMEGIGMGDAEVKPQEKTLSDNSESNKFKVYQAIDLAQYPYDHQIVLLSARNEDEAHQIIETYTDEFLGEYIPREWGIKETRKKAPQDAGPGVLWSNFDDFLGD